MMRRLLLLSAVLCAGCVSAPPMKVPHWDRAGGTADAYAYDRGQCLAKSSAAPVDETSRLYVFNGCMEEKGWRRQ